MGRQRGKQWHKRRTTTSCRTGQKGTKSSQECLSRCNLTCWSATLKLQEVYVLVRLSVCSLPPTMFFSKNLLQHYCNQFLRWLGPLNTAKLSWAKFKEKCQYVSWLYRVKKNPVCVRKRLNIDFFLHIMLKERRVTSAQWFWLLRETALMLVTFCPSCYNSQELNQLAKFTFHTFQSDYHLKSILWPVIFQGLAFPNY